ncbi:unnamed protein product [Closterium sp. NIES-53]
MAAPPNPSYHALPTPSLRPSPTAAAAAAAAAAVAAAAGSGSSSSARGGGSSSAGGGAEMGAGGGAGGAGGAGRGAGGGMGMGMGIGMGVFQQGFSDVTRRYEMGRKVGQGRKGVTVYQCVERRTGRQYACKTIDKVTLTGGRKEEAVRTEVAIMRKLQGHPHIVEIKDTAEDAKFVHIIMEMCSGGDLLDHINTQLCISEREAATIVRVLVQTIHFCHVSGIMHRDLKPENVLLGSPGQWWDLRVADFGFSVPLRAGQRMKGYAGSPFYMAPEVLDGLYGHEADIWSLGVILYTLLSQKLPFWDDTDAGVYELIRRCEVDTSSGVWPLVSGSAKDLVHRMLAFDPNHRLPLHLILGTEFFSLCCAWF